MIFFIVKIMIEINFTKGKCIMKLNKIIKERRLALNFT